jgi:hypothetical protein
MYSGSGDQQVDIDTLRRRKSRWSAGFVILRSMDVAAESHIEFLSEKSGIAMA